MGEHTGKDSSIRKMNPVIYDRMLRVGERLSETSLSFDIKHPIILLGKHHFTDLNIRDKHEKIGHRGT